MALATNSTPGSIVLAGDLTGTANAPQLRITGVVPGSYTATTIIVDDKGRVVRATNGVIENMVGEVSGAYDGTAFTSVVLTNTSATPGSFTLSNITVDEKGRITSASNGSLPSLAGDVSGSIGSNSLATTSVTPGSYVRSNITVDAKGRITAASTGTNPTLGGDLTGPLTATVLPTSGVTAGSYTVSNITVDAKGRITAASNGSLPSLAGDLTGLYGSNALSSTGITPGLYTQTDITVDAKGRITSVSNGTPVVLAGDANGQPFPNSISLATTGVVAGTYTSADITVDAKGRVTSAANGSFLGSYTSKGVIQVGAGLLITSGVLSLPAATGGAEGTATTADTANITITSGQVNVGTNVPKLNTNNVFDKAIHQIASVVYGYNDPVSGTSINLNDTNYQCTFNTTFMNFPTNASVGDKFNIGISGIGTPCGGTVFSGDTFLSSWSIADIIWTGTFFVFVASGTNSIPTKNIRFGYANSSGGYWVSAGHTSALTGAYCLGYNGSTLYCAGVYNGVYTKSVANSSTAPSGTWTYTNLGYSIFSIAYGSSKFVARDSSGRGRYSSNGTAWTDTSTTIPASNIVWNGSQFLCVGGTNEVGISATGTSWTVASTLPTTTGTWIAVAWNGTQYCAVARGDDICATSTDGVTWTSHSLPYVADWSSIAWNGSVFCIVATSGSTNDCLTSADGATWSTRKYGYGVESSQYMKKIVAGNSRFVTVSHLGETAIISPTYNVTFDTKYKFSNSPSGDDINIECIVAPNGNAYCTYK